MSDIRWLAEHHEDGVLNGRVGRRGADLVAEWVGVARLEVARDGSNVRFTPDPIAAPEDVEKIRLGSARALLRHLDGGLALHGSAVAIGDRAIAFIGDADAGKSTLAATLCTRHGGVLLADDTIALDHVAGRFDVLPLDIDHWLDIASREALDLRTTGPREKRPLRASTARSPVPLATVVHVSFEPVDNARLTLLSEIQAVATLLPQVLRFVIDEPDVHRRELDTLADLVGCASVARLVRPKRFDHLETTAAMATELIATGVAR